LVEIIAFFVLGQNWAFFKGLIMNDFPEEGQTEAISDEILTIHASDVNAQ
jgi:hypothetical protein